MSTPHIRMRMLQNFEHRLLKRSFNQVSREASRKALEHHAEVNIPRHFEANAPRRYGYSRRTSFVSISALNLPESTKASLRIKYRGSRIPYTHAKKRLGLSPMKWSGETQRMTSNPFFRKITYTSTKGGKLTIRMPAYITSRIRVRRISFLDQVKGKTYQPTQQQEEAIRRASEMEAITPKEVSDLQQIWRREFLAINNNPSHPKHHLVKLRQRAAHRRRRRN